VFHDGVMFHDDGVMFHDDGVMFHDDGVMFHDDGVMFHDGVRKYLISKQGGVELVHILGEMYLNKITINTCVP
jgi:hypothetical protein